MRYRHAVRAGQLLFEKGGERLAAELFDDHAQLIGAVAVDKLFARWAAIGSAVLRATAADTGSPGSAKY